VQDVAPEQPKRAVEGQHDGVAELVSAEPVKEIFQGKTVREGAVHIVDLDGYPEPTRAYAWSSSIDGTERRRFHAVRHRGSIRSPLHAVRAPMAAERGGQS
jgi:hypothetical protein